MDSVTYAGRIRVEDKTSQGHHVFPIESDSSISMCVHHYACQARHASFATGTTSSGPSLNVLPFLPPSSPELAILDSPPGGGGFTNALPAHYPIRTFLSYSYGQLDRP